MWVINVPHERQINMLSCTEISSVISFFSFEKVWVKLGLPSTQLNLANTQNMEKINFDMFYKNYCWAVICYPICVTNASYNREVIVLSFPVISFVILIFVFRDSILNLGFLFIDSHCIGSGTNTINALSISSCSLSTDPGSSSRKPLRWSLVIVVLSSGQVHLSDAVPHAPDHQKPSCYWRLLLNRVFTCSFITGTVQPKRNARAI